MELWSRKKFKNKPEKNLQMKTESQCLVFKKTPTVSEHLLQLDVCCLGTRRELVLK